MTQYKRLDRKKNTAITEELDIFSLNGMTDATEIMEILEKNDEEQNSQNSDRIRTQRKKKIKISEEKMTDQWKRSVKQYRLIFYRRGFSFFLHGQWWAFQISH